MRYEDLVSNEHTLPMLKLLYDFMGFPYDLERINSTLGDLLHGGGKRDHRGYYSLNRDTDFDPNHWKLDLNIDVRSNMCSNIFWLNTQKAKFCFRVCQRLRGRVGTLSRN